MNVPHRAHQSFRELKDKEEYVRIVEYVLSELNLLKTNSEKVRFVHQLIDRYNQIIFSNPIVQDLSPCKRGCSACCHTQVSVTEEEAELLHDHIKKGLTIDHEKLSLQKEAKDDYEAYFTIPYDQRACIFLDEDGICKVYQDRPSVCRTNAVLGDASQCDTSEAIRPVRLLLTLKADMVIYAFYVHTSKSGTLPHMLDHLIREDLDF